MLVGLCLLVGRDVGDAGGLLGEGEAAPEGDALLLADALVVELPEGVEGDVGGVMGFVGCMGAISWPTPNSTPFLKNSYAMYLMDCVISRDSSRLSFRQ